VILLILFIGGDGFVDSDPLKQFAPVSTKTIRLRAASQWAKTRPRMDSLIPEVQK